MTVLWIIPAAIAVAGFIALVVATLRVAEEAAALRGQVVRLGELRPALVEVRTQYRGLRSGYGTLAGRRR